MAAQLPFTTTHLSVSNIPDDACRLFVAANRSISQTAHNSGTIRIGLRAPYRVVTRVIRMPRIVCRDISPDEVAVKKLLDEREISDGVDRLAQQISQEYWGRPLTIIGVLT